MVGFQEIAVGWQRPLEMKQKLPQIGARLGVA
jgi:hypothetical protein